MVVTHDDRCDRCTLRIACTRKPENATVLEQKLTDALYRERHMFPDLIRDGVVHPLAIEWIPPDDLITNPRTGKQMRLIDRRIV